MSLQDVQKILVGAVLIGCGYLLGASGPPASALAQDASIMKQVVYELGNIRRELSRINSNLGRGR